TADAPLATMQRAPEAFVDSDHVAIRVRSGVYEDEGTLHLGGDHEGLVLTSVLSEDETRPVVEGSVQFTAGAAATVNGFEFNTPNAGPTERYLGIAYGDLAVTLSDNVFRFPGDDEYTGNDVGMVFTGAASAEVTMVGNTFIIEREAAGFGQDFAVFVNPSSPDEGERGNHVVFEDNTIDGGWYAGLRLEGDSDSVV